MAWKHVVSIALDGLVWAATALLVLSITGLGKRPKGARDLGGGQVEFGAAGWLSSWSDLAFEIFLVSLAVNQIRHNRGDWFSTMSLILYWAAAIGGLVWLAFEQPGTMVATEDGLEQRFWLRPNKRMRWSEIVEVQTGIKQPDVAITSADGTKMVHSLRLAGRERLLLELKRHCGDDLPPDFPREAIPAG